MAKLTPKDPQFGIPVATRIQGELALRFNAEAAKENKTLSRYIAEFIERAAANEEMLNDLEAQLIEERELSEVYERNFNELQTEFANENEKFTAKEKLIKELEALLAKEKGTLSARDNRVKELEAQIIKERTIAKNTSGKFILKISEGNKKQATQLIETYNTILKDERQNNL